MKGSCGEEVSGGEETLSLLVIQMNQMKREGYPSVEKRQDVSYFEKGF